MSGEAIQTVVMGHCPKCGPERRAEVHGYLQRTWHDSEEPIWETANYRLLRCCGCEEVFFQSDTVFSEDMFTRNTYAGGFEHYFEHRVRHWPTAPSRARPVWLGALRGREQILADLVEDIYSALDADLSVLAALGIRTAFDVASGLLGVNPTFTFVKKLDELADRGKIGCSERKALSVVIDAGGAAAHRNWRPTQEELGTMTDVMENFLQRTFILHEEVKLLSVPPRKRA